MKQPLTNAQSQVLKFVRMYLKKYGIPPTRQEITTGFGWSSANAAQQHLVAIQRKGYIEFVGRKSRGIRVVA